MPNSLASKPRRSLRSKRNRLRTVSFDELDLDVSDDEDRSVVYPEFDNRFGPCEDDCEDRLTARENVFDLGHCAEESYGSEHGSPLNFSSSWNDYQRASVIHQRRVDSIAEGMRIEGI